METIQATLGQALLVLVALAVLLFTLILLLIEADYILRLGEKLTRRWRSGGSSATDSDPPRQDEDGAQRPRDEQRSS